MSYSGFAAAQYADSHAEPHSTGNCAKYVRRAIGWGGITLQHTYFAKDYGSALEQAGFYEVAPYYGSPQRGDVIVIQSIVGHPAGHMAIFDGLVWVSDFKQNPVPDGFYPSSAYRQIKPHYKVYRHD